MKSECSMGWKCALFVSQTVVCKYPVPPGAEPNNFWKMPPQDSIPKKMEKIFPKKALQSPKYRPNKPPEKCAPPPFARYCFQI